MKQQLICMAVALGVLAGCGDSGGSSDPKCQTGACGAQRFCAHTPDGGVCWKDTTAPVISASSMTCSTTPCRRDSVLTVTATVADESYGNAMGEVKVALDLDKEHPLTLQRVSPTGNDYRLDVKVEDLPFPYFAHDVAGTVSAKDEATNGATQELAAVGVTRMKWALALPGQGGTAYALFSPAITSDGRIIVVGSDGSVHFVTRAGAEERTPVVVGSVVTAPAALGPNAIWLSGQDQKLHKRALSDGSELALSHCAAATNLVGSPAVFGERAVSVSSGVQVLVATTDGSCNISNTGSFISSPPVMDRAGALLVSSGGSLQKYTVAEDSTLTSAWAVVPAPSVGTVAEPIAIDGGNAAWTIASNGVLSRTTAEGVTSQVSAAPSIASSGCVVLSDGSVVIADFGGSVRRITPDGTTPWSANPPALDHPRTPLVLGGQDPSLLVPTTSGMVYAIRQSTGEVVWSTLVASQALQPPNIWTESGAKTSTAYLASANGTLYAVIVDGTLDTTAPWPKAYHDPQNTSNAATSF